MMIVGKVLLLAVPVGSVVIKSSHPDSQSAFPVCQLPEDTIGLLPCNPEAERIDDVQCKIPHEFCNRHDSEEYRHLDNCQPCSYICDNNYDDSGCKEKCPWYLLQQCLDGLYGQLHLIGSVTESDSKLGCTGQVEKPDTYKVLFFVLLSIMLGFIGVTIILRWKGFLKIVFIRHPPANDRRHLRAEQGSVIGDYEMAAPGDDQNEELGANVQANNREDAGSVNSGQDDETAVNREPGSNSEDPPGQETYPKQAVEDADRGSAVEDEASEMDSLRGPESDTQPIEADQQTAPSQYALNPMSHHVKLPGQDNI